MIKTFLKSEDGAVTIDWMLLVGIILLLCAVLFSAMNGGLDQMTANIAADLAAQLKGDHTVFQRYDAVN